VLLGKEGKTRAPPLTKGRLGGVIARQRLIPPFAKGGIDKTGVFV